MRKILLALLLGYCAVGHSQIKPSGMLLSAKNANTKTVKDFTLVSANDKKSPVELVFETQTCVGVSREDNKWYVLPLNGVAKSVRIRICGFYHRMRYRKTILTWLNYQHTTRLPVL